MTKGMWGVFLVAMVLGTGLPTGALLGQQDSVPSQAPGGLPGDTIELVFEREVFTYPQYERRNPFRPLTGEDSAGPRFEDLVLMGRILSSNPASSIALVGALPAGASSGQLPSRTFRLRTGDVIGNSRILEIREQAILVEVEEFGLRETRVLELRRASPTVAPAPVQADVVPGPTPEALPNTAPDPTTNDPAPDGASADLTQNGNGGRS
ncbi:MAG: hypothetical protein WD056_00985 [Gemmatimonadota bacterium]